MTRFIVRDPERTRRQIGLALYVICTVAGGALLQLIFLLPLLAERNGMRHLENMGVGATLAFPAVLVYMTVPRLLDRYDPEPWWALVMVFVWGALAACGFSATINTYIGHVIGQREAAMFSAPVVEEFWKGLAVFWMFYFWRREFDGLVDGVIYAIFVALGFAAIENVIYYAQAGAESGDKLTGTFILRGVITPWAHPLFTSMTGLGFGLAREGIRPWVRSLAPLGGYLLAVVLHMIWNSAALFSSSSDVPLMMVLLPLWFLAVAAFGALMFALVLRRGRIIRAYLRDEVLLGTLTGEELQLAGSAFGQFHARWGVYGRVRAELVQTAARLALSKWHAVRASEGNRSTLSFEFIHPLRQHIQALRAQLPASHPRPSPRPPPVAAPRSVRPPPR